MSRFQVSQVNNGGEGGSKSCGIGSCGTGENHSVDVLSHIPNDGNNDGIENLAMDPVELNVYGLYSKRNSVGCSIPGELKRKSSYGFTHITR